MWGVGWQLLPDLAPGSFRESSLNGSHMPTLWASRIPQGATGENHAKKGPQHETRESNDRMGEGRRPPKRKETGGRGF